MSDITIIEHETAPLTAADVRRLEALERTIQDGMQTFLAVGNALNEIRDKRLYRDKFNRFEDYCREQWRLSKTHANRLIDAAQVVASLPPELPAPATESQARELASIADVDERARVWATVNNGSGKPTAAAIKTAVQELTREVEDADLWERIDKAYSADVIAQERSIKRPVEYDGALWIGTGTAMGGNSMNGINIVSARRIVPLADWQGESWTYREKASHSHNGDRLGYIGVRIRHGNVEYVMTHEKLVVRKPRFQKPDNYEQVKGDIYAIGWNLTDDGKGWRVHNITVPHNFIPFKTWDEVENWLVQAEERKKQQERAARVLADNEPTNDEYQAMQTRFRENEWVQLYRSDAGWTAWPLVGSKKQFKTWADVQAFAAGFAPPSVPTPDKIASSLLDRLAALGGKLDRSEVVGGVTVHHYRTRQGRFVVEHANFPGVLDMLERAEGKGKAKAPAIELPKAPEGWGWESDMQGAYPRHRLHQLGGNTTTNYYQSPSDAIDEAFEIAGTVQLFSADEVDSVPVPAPKGASPANNYYRDPELERQAYMRFKEAIDTFMRDGSPAARLIWLACLTEDQKHNNTHLADVLWQWAWPNPVVADLANRLRQEILETVGLIEA